MMKDSASRSGGRQKAVMAVVVGALIAVACSLEAQWTNS
jgi:hypothetical protein